MTAPDELVALVETFEANLESYKRTGFKEYPLREEYINPLFGLLGWDVSNKNHAPEHLKDVVHEDQVRIGSSATAPDYAFRVGGQRVFLLEAKKPAVNISESAKSAYQLRRYAWNLGLPVSLLTDFTELALYDCSKAPRRNAVPSTGRLKVWTCAQFVTDWDEISSILSRDAVVAGGLARFAKNAIAAGPTAQVGKAFLKEIEAWREILAQQFAQDNPTLNSRELNSAVQLTIDRILFLRICEARGMETAGELRELLVADDAYARLQGLFRHAEQKYNSGLFHFSVERGRASEVDSLTPLLKLANGPLREIVGALDGEDSPYDFSVMPVDVLGQVYEQFLGKVIQLDRHHVASIDYKPEVRKSGGVYYTPTWVVEYIVSNTLGPALAGKSPKSAALIRVLDPACGSGSFLLGAYQYLLDWHLDWYRAHSPEKHRSEIMRTVGGGWRLTTSERKRILLANIYGVDIDRQAVEVAKLSLAIKVLEGETAETIGQTLRLFQERALPELERNIRCGNSLIESDFYEGRLPLPDDDFDFSVNAFNWADEFPEAIGGGGFDVVLGNPPYFSVDDTWGKGDQRKDYLSRRFPRIYADKTDILYYFLAQAVDLSKGMVGFVVSRAFLEAFKAQRLRSWLSENATLSRLVDFRDVQVFPGVGIAACIAIFDASGPPEGEYCRPGATFSPPALLAGEADLSCVPFSRMDLSSAPWIFVRNEDRSISASIDGAGAPLEKFVHLGQGMQTGRNGVFAGFSLAVLDDWQVPQAARFMRARNSQVKGVFIEPEDDYILYLEDYDDFASLPTGVQRHLKKHEPQLRARAAFQRGNCEWWKFTWPLHKELVRTPRLISPFLSGSNRFGLDLQAEFLGLTDTTVLHKTAFAKEDLRYIAGLLNSELLTFRFRQMAKDKGNGIYEYFWNNLRGLRVHQIDFNSKAECDLHQTIVGIVDSLVAIDRRVAESRVSQDRRQLSRVASGLNGQLNEVVEVLYGLEGWTSRSQ